MAAAVQLVINVDESGAVNAINKITGAAQNLGNVIPATGQKASAAFANVQQSTEKAHIAGQAFARLTGFTLPRGVETWLSKTSLIGPALSSAFGLIVGGTIGLAFVDLGVKAVGALGNIMDSLGGYTEAVKKMQTDTVAASREAFLNPKSIEVAIQHLAEVTTQLSLIEQQKKSLDDALNNQDGISQVTPGTFDADTQAMAELVADRIKLNDLTAKENQLGSDANALLKKKAELAKQLNELEDAGDSKLREAGKQGFALIQQQYADAQQTITATAAATQEGAKVTAAKSRDAYGGYINAVIAMERQSAAETIALRHSVMEESSQGISKIHQIEADAIEDINTKRRASLITEANAAEQSVLIEARAAEQERQAVAALASQHRDAALFAQQRANAFLSGSEKIKADAELETQTLLKGAADVAVKYGFVSQEAAAAWADAQTKIEAVDKAANAQLLVNHQQLVDKLSDMQSAAAIAALPQWQRADAQILLTHQKTYEEINRLELTDRKNVVVYEQQKVAADQLMNAQMIDSHRQMAEQLGSDLSTVFDDIGSGNIGKRILANIKKLFAQIVAAWLLSTKVMGSTFGKFFGSIVGGPGSTLEQASGGGILGGLLGQSSSAPVFGTPPFLPGGATAGAAASGGVFGSDLNFGGGLNFGGSGSLTGSPLGTAAQAATSGGLSIGPLSAGKGLSGLFSAAGARGLGGLAAILGGSALGGVGQIGGIVTGLALMAASNPNGPAAALLGHLGIFSSAAAEGALIGVGSGLLGFGLGEQFGKVGGILGGAGAGALTGFLTFGPIGAIIGGLAGLFGGLFGGIFGGGKRKRQANALFNGTIGPDITKIEAEYKGFQLDYASAIGQLEDLKQQAHDQLHKLKGEGDSVFKHKVSPAIDAAEKDLSGFETERQRRAGLAFAPPEFHGGGFVEDSLMSSRRRPGEMLAVLKRGEFVINPQATAKNRGALEQINAGGSAGVTFSGGIIINTGMVDKDYMTRPTGFKRDLLRAINSLQKEGRL
ncbi:MAG TPA: hypothetical protein VJN64_04920 [Terriglobales bacterium]|nr:hypothetical protein [Terriglobales bacterium]